MPVGIERSKILNANYDLQKNSCYFVVKEKAKGKNSAIFRHNDAELSEKKCRI